MEGEDYEDDDELEARNERELERRGNEPFYMHESWEKFCANPTVISAKKLWLKYTILGECVPENVTTLMVAIIKKQVEDQQEKLSSENVNKKFDDDRLFALLHIAKTDLNLFWQMLHEPEACNMTCFLDLDDNILERLRSWLPEKRKFMSNELYSIFDVMMQGKKKPPDGPPYTANGIEQRYRKRYPKQKVSFL